ncbi:TPA: restriction endonuclease subunit S [Enterococcus faecalis]|uniref:restriction endonuclease subunit S n=1 Tax=Enterococcus faecalis TaxID=1351 RepID=UPI001A0FB6CE|nr:restriction endonuclease subunit S [Enterococcus faecalis]EGO8850493.1 restriction endonuclease subunit S [Enterococcus faecalis]EGO8906265.1 restriction endonuclease subunit S [Enterococcus faecalis]MCP9739129.1 restriction endonuclease subunit S [Enterococcus faecalis]HAP3858215.1 restriction endonuclease subunit S [Enterococcus faecalis]HBI1969596.1 restriction endonuclease subunit S [Enterococcus faecalis]
MIVFTLIGVWELCKFKGLLDEQDGIRRGPFGSALKKAFFVENSEYVVYEQQNAIYDTYETRYKISKEKFKELEKFSISEGDFIMSGAGTIGRISRVPKGVAKGVFNQALIRFRTNTEVTDSEYFIQFVRADKMQKKLTGANPGSAITNLVPMSEIKKWDILIPSKKEQILVGLFLKKLDNTITLHQRKSDQLKELKKAYLQLMFPTKEERVPKLRFAAFEGEWAHRKLGEITESFSGGTPTAGKSEYYGGDIPFIRSGEISSDSTELFITENGLNSSSAKMVKVGDILYALYGATSGEVGISKITGAINQAILAIRPSKNDNSYLIIQWLRKQKNTIISTYLQGGQGNLSSSIVKNLIIMLPQNKEEQEKVGMFFKQLDNIITLHQNKLEQLKDLKTSYLQNMFI